MKNCIRERNERSQRYDFRACAMMNSDLRSITAEWVKYLLILMTPLYFARVAPPSSLFSSILYP